MDRRTLVRRRRRIVWRGALVMLGAAALGLTMWSGTDDPPASERPELAVLVEAARAEPHRFAEGRLAGGFPYAPAPQPPRGRTAASPGIRIAAARLEQLAAERETPGHAAALGVARLATGDVDEAVMTLEEAARERPQSAAIQIDLSAAYLERARRLDRPDDLPRALAAAERAIAASPGAPEAHFNRALALEALHLRSRALEAWAALRAVERDAAWLREADAREGALRANDDADAGADHQARREAIEERLLARWASALLDGDAGEAARALADARAEADALAGAGGDTMARDAVRAIGRVQQSGDRGALERLARGHLGYARAHAALRNDDLEGARQAMEEAARSFRAAGSPYALWGPIFQAIAHRMHGATDEALRLLREMRVDALPAGYRHIRGRHLWTEGAAYASLGRYDLAGDRYRDALALFTRAGELEYRTVHHAYVAEADWVLGDRTSAWRHQLAALARVDRLPPSTRRSAILYLAAFFALDNDLPETALHIQNALVDYARASGLDARLSKAHMQRGRIQARLGRHAEAMADVRAASDAAGRIADPAVRARDAAEIEAIRAEVLADADPAASIAHANRAIAYFRQGGFGARLAELLSLRARAHLAHGDTDAAVADLHAALDEFERDRSRLQAIVDRLQAFDEERRAFSQLFALEVRRGRHDQALRVLERSRTGGLAATPTGAPTAVDPLAARHALPDEVAFVYLAAQEPQPLLWVLTRDAATQLDVPIGTRELARAADRVRRLILRGEDFATVAPASAPLVEALVRPVLSAAGDRRTLVFVPDGPLLSLPLGVLPDAAGRPLVAGYRVLTAPSLTAFLGASSRLRGFAADEVLTVGDGHRPEQSGLPRLPHADDEARAVAALYPSSRVLVSEAASPGRVLEREHAVVHFAGHAVANRRMPVLSRLLLAPDATPPGSAGGLSGADILARRFTRTRLVVLGTCEGAAGRIVDGDGVLSLATLFLGAGAGAVVGSYWPVEDRVQPVLVALHRELRRLGDPAAALRAAQLEVLARDAAAPVRTWGAFVAVGGLVPGTQGVR